MELRAVAQAYLENFADEGQQHPALEELIRFREEDLDAAEQERVMLHIAACDQCAQALLDFDRFPDIEPRRPSEPISEERIAEGWQSLQQRLSNEQDQRRTNPWRVLWPLAAALLAACVGLIAWLQWQGGEPVQNLEIVALQPENEAGSRAAIEPVTLASASGGVVLILGGSGLGAFSSYHASIRAEGADERSSWRTGSLFLKPEGTLNLTIPRRRLVAGRYRIEVRSPQAGEEVLTTYRFDLRLEAP